MKRTKMITATSLILASALVGCTIPGNSNSTTLPINVNNPLKQNNANNLGAQAEKLTITEEPTEEEMRALSGAAIDVFYNTIAQGEEGENILLSPASLTFALAMTENGARGQTLDEMEKYVNGDISIEDLNVLLYNLSSKLEDSKGVDWSVANSIWLNDDGETVYSKDFINKAVSYYNAEVLSETFKEETIKEVNDWISDHTKGRIDNVLQQLDPSARVILVNAICFDGEWEEKYEEDRIYENRKFYNSDGTTSDVTMLGSNENRYFELGEGVGFIKPYKGGEFSFVGILPNEGVSTEEYIKGLNESGADFSEAIRNAQNQEVIVTMPEFKADTYKSMIEIYQQMGMVTPFSETDADLSGMFEGAENDCTWISQILHKTYIEVDRKGTKAAAATVVVVDKCTAVMPEATTPVITLDRPFVYAIVDNETGVPIFIGVENNMK